MRLHVQHNLGSFSIAYIAVRLAAAPFVYAGDVILSIPGKDFDKGYDEDTATSVADLVNFKHLFDEYLATMTKGKDTAKVRMVLE